MSVALRFTDLTCGYGKRPAVHHLNAEAPAGALIAVVGPNGAGKSTLLKAIAGEIAPISGAIETQGSKRPRIGVMPQQSSIDRTAPVDVETLVAAGLWRKRGFWGGMSHADREAVAQALADVGLEGFARRPLKTLSGGQLQRALFARLMVEDAEILLLDEPFAALDAPTAQRLLERVLAWNGAGRTVIAVLHDLELVRASFPTTLLIAREQIAFGPTAKVLTAENLLRARAMGEAWQEGAQACTRQAAA